MRSEGSALLETYQCSEPFQALADDTAACKSALAAITYTMQITPGRIDIARYAGEADYSAQVEETFERFSQGVAKDYRVTFRGWPGVDRIGAEVLNIVARLYVDEFATLDAYCQRHPDFVNRTIRKFERDLDFYLAYRDYIDPLKMAGLPFCRPRSRIEERSSGRDIRSRPCLQDGDERAWPRRLQHP